MKYHQLIEADIQYLQDIVGAAGIIHGSAISESYSHDEMKIYGDHLPEVVVKPSTAQQVSEIMKYANLRRIPVTPRGSGTGLCGGCVPIYGGILLTTEGINKIIEIDGQTLSATVEPGVLLMDLISETSKAGYLYAPDPGEKSATIGGNVMTNAGGMRAVKHGVTRDYVLGMEVVLPTGEIELLGGKVAKNSSGYSLKDLMIGSEGTLGIVTKIIVKLLPKPNEMLSLLVPFNSIEEALDCVLEVLKKPYIPTTCEFMERDVLIDSEDFLGREFPDNKHNAYLIVSYTGDDEKALKSIVDDVVKTLFDQGAIDVLLSNTLERQGELWTSRGAFLEAIKSSTTVMDECDVVLPKDQLKNFSIFVKELQEEHGVRIRIFGHAGDGNVHVYVCKDDLEDYVWEVKIKVIMDTLYDYSIRVGGQVSGEHGIGHAKKKYLHNALGEKQISLMREIKRVFDPNLILNPGKIID